MVLALIGGVLALVGGALPWIFERRHDGLRDDARRSPIVSEMRGYQIVELRRLMFVTAGSMQVAFVGCLLIMLGFATPWWAFALLAGIWVLMTALAFEGRAGVKLHEAYANRSLTTRQLIQLVRVTSLAVPRYPLDVRLAHDGKRIVISHDRTVNTFAVHPGDAQDALSKLLRSATYVHAKSMTFNAGMAATIPQAVPRTTMKGL